MAFYKKAAKGKNPGTHSYTPEDMKRVQWCLDKNIGVAVSPSGTNWKVEIRMNKGDWKRDPKDYQHEEAMEKMYKYYKYYYDKHNLNTNDNG